MSKINLSEIIVKNWTSYKRDFVWRHIPTPYKIMIAEFMLQRTRAEQVEPVYKKFLATYPDVISLARAEEESVCIFTNNLGLHKRSQHFIKAARYIVDNYQGKFPENRESLLKIPGVGDYVAGAMLTVCFNKPEYVIDSNIARFFNRYYGLNLKGEIRRKKEILSKAKRIFRYPDTRNLLFALIDFASLICKSKNPDHDNCVLKKTCKFYKTKKKVL